MFKLTDFAKQFVLVIVDAVSFYRIGIADVQNVFFLNWHDKTSLCDLMSTGVDFTHKSHRMCMKTKSLISDVSLQHLHLPTGLLPLIAVSLEKRFASQTSPIPSKEFASNTHVAFA